MALLSTSRLINTLSTIYGESAGKETRALLQQLKLPETLHLVEGILGDGIAEIEKWDADGKNSSLSFNEKGDLYLNLLPIPAKLPPPAARLLLATFFGKEELREELPFEEARLLEAAVGFYQCGELEEERQECQDTILASVAPYQIAAGAALLALDPNSSKMSYDLYNRATHYFLNTMKRMLKVAEKRDWGPGGWDPDDFLLIYEMTEDLLEALPNETRNEARARFLKAEKNFLKTLQTNSGFEACFEMGLCYAASGEYYNGTSVEMAFKIHGGGDRNKEDAHSSLRLAGK